MNSPLQCCAQITYLKEKSFSDHASALLTLLSSNNFSFCTSNANVSFSLSRFGEGVRRTGEGANIIFVGRFRNVVSDDSFHLDACFSFLSNILSICIATKRKNIVFLFASQQKERILVRGEGVHNPLLGNHTSPYPLLLRRGYSSLYKSRLVKDV